MQSDSKTEPDAKKAEASARAKKWYWDNRAHALETRLAYRKRNLADVRAQRAKYRAENRERVLAQRNASAARNRAGIRKRANERRTLNKDKINAHLREVRRSRPEKQRSDNVAQYRKHKERNKPKRAAWKKNNPDKVYNSNVKRRAKKRGLSEHHTAADVKEIWERQNHKCAVPGCSNEISAVSGKHRFHVDHIQALINEGSDAKNNIQILCGPCNLEKGSQDEYIWAQERLRTLFPL